MIKKSISIDKRNIEIGFTIIALLFAITSFVCLFGDIVVEKTSLGSSTLLGFSYFTKTYPKEIEIIIHQENTPSFLMTFFTETLLVLSFLAAFVLNIVFITLGFINLIQFFQNKKELNSRHFLRCTFYTFVVCMVGMTYFYKESSSINEVFGWGSLTSIILCLVITILYWIKKILIDEKEAATVRNNLLKASTSFLLLIGGIIGTTKQFSQGGSNGSALDLLNGLLDLAMQGEVDDIPTFLIRCLSLIMCFTALLLTLIAFYKEIVPPKKGNKGLTRIIVILSITIVGIILYFSFYLSPSLGIGLIVMVITQVICLILEIIHFVNNKKTKETEKLELNK